MPGLLKLIVVSGFLFPLFVITSIIHSSVNVFGHDLPEETWWISGGDPFTVVIGSLMWSAAIQLLKRSIIGVPIYVAAWILMTISIPIVAIRLSLMSEEAMFSLTSNLIIVVILAVYLYRSKSVRNYFHAAT